METSLFCCYFIYILFTTLTLELKLISKKISTDETIASVFRYRQGSGNDEGIPNKGGVLWSSTFQNLEQVDECDECPACASCDDWRWKWRVQSFDEDRRRVQIVRGEGCAETRGDDLLLQWNNWSPQRHPNIWRQCPVVWKIVSCVDLYFLLSERKLEDFLCSGCCWNQWSSKSYKCSTIVKDYNLRDVSM